MKVTQIAPVEGARSAVRAAISTADNLDQPTRDAVCNWIDKMPGEFNGARVTGSIQVVNNLTNVHITIEGRKMAG